MLTFAKFNSVSLRQILSCLLAHFLLSEAQFARFTHTNAADLLTHAIQTSRFIAGLFCLGRLSEPDASRHVKIAFREPLFLQYREMAPNGPSAL